MPSSFLSAGVLALALAATPVTATSYSLLHHFDADNFFQNFSLTTGADPTHGFVEYVDYDTAQSSGLASIKSGNVYLGVDHTNKYTTGGRPSTRVESNVYFKQGLLIADFAHMPASACGVWPAFWTVGRSWPADGEIDIIEGVNKQTTNQMVMHTQGDCQITSNDQTGETTAGQCSLSTGTSGCIVKGTQGSYGDDFNAGGGGVYALEWTSKFIKIWYFPRGSIPASITAGKPDSAEFGTPMGNFQGSCNVGDEFQEQRIIINTDFCGDWAGGVYGSSGCPLSNSGDASASCAAYVGNNPEAFKDAYWEIKSIQVYQQGAGPTSVPPKPPTSTAKPTTVKQTTTGKPTTVKSATTTPTPAEPTTPTTVHSTSTATHTSSRTKSSSSAHRKPSTTPCSSPGKSTVTVTSFTTAPPSVEPSATPTSKLTTTTIVTTSIVDVCPTGYTTKTITHTVTYCPADATTAGGVPPGFTTTAKPCPTGCGSGPTTVIVTVPTVPATATPTDVSPETSPAPEATTQPAPAPPASVVPPPASVPPVSVPPASVPAASVPPASVPPASVPGASVPGGSVPGGSVPGASVPGASVAPTSIAPVSTPAANPRPSPAPPAPKPSSSVAIPSVVTPTTWPASTPTAVSPQFTNAAGVNQPGFVAAGFGAVIAAAMLV